jgi:hypothetical protein
MTLAELISTGNDRKSNVTKIKRNSCFIQKLYYLYTMKNNIKQEITNELYKFMNDNYNTIDEVKKFCDEIIIKQQNEILRNPKVYVAKTRDPKTDIYYLNCKLFFPISISERKEVKVYIGKLSDFPKGCNDTTAKKIGKENMKEKLKKIIENKFGIMV